MSETQNLKIEVIIDVVKIYKTLSEDVSILIDITKEVDIHPGDARKAARMIFAPRAGAGRAALGEAAKILLFDAPELTIAAAFLRLTLPEGQWTDADTRALRLEHTEMTKGYGPDYDPDRTPFDIFAELVLRHGGGDLRNIPNLLNHLPTEELDAVRKALEEANIDVDVILKFDFEQKCFAAGTPIDMADGSQKPIEQVGIGDVVLAYDPEQKDGLGELAARRVTRTYATPDKMVLDFHGVLVTPGHVFLCGDGLHKGKHRMLIDILRDDGAVVAADGRVIRAATNAPLGSAEDAFLQVRYLPEGSGSAHREGRLRAGTLLLTEAGETASILQLLDAEGYQVGEDGLIARDGEEPHPLHWYGALPRPEDYVLQVSNLTDADLSGDLDYVPDVATEEGAILGAGWSPVRQDGDAPSLFLAGAPPKHGGETLH